MPTSCTPPATSSSRSSSPHWSRRSAPWSTTGSRWSCRPAAPRSCTPDPAAPAGMNSPASAVFGVASASAADRRVVVSQRIVAIAFAVCAACGGSKSKPNLDLAVTSFSPTADTTDPATPIKLQFDQPVVAEAEVGVPLTAVPVTIAPELAVDAHWADRQTLVLKPSAGLAPSTRYAVRLTGPLAQRAGDKEYSFVHKPLAVEGVTGADLERAPPRPDLVIRFNQPVRADQVAARCKLAPKDGGDGVALVTADPAVVDQSIAVTTAAALPQGKDFELRCADLGGAGGNVGLAEPYTL